MAEELGTQAFDPSRFILDYFDCWNRGDIDGIVRFFAAGGVYSDPAITGEVGIDMMRAYLGALRKGFPDLRWEPLVEPIFNEARRVVVCEWKMTGTQSGTLAATGRRVPFDLPPTGQVGEATGIDVIRLNDKHRIVHHATYFDQLSVYESLGFRVLIHPPELEGAKLGLGAYLAAEHATKVAPEGYSLTWIDPRDAKEGEGIVQATQLIMADMKSQPGFMGWVAAVFDQRMFTITAWRSCEDAVAAVRNGPHALVAQEFFEGRLGRAQHAVIAEVKRRGPLLVIGEDGRPIRDTEALPDSQRPAWW